MGLNIKNERVHTLARDVARRTGRTQTSAIELALSRLIEELDRQEGEAARRERVQATVADMQARVARANVDLAADDLYDGAGLPT
ncbi:MAG: type II toxin-antitoxin system VapB family antitoxin [Ornithinimicrobium sp.]|jgi:antitoxin VapB|uniref:type II toxin-antitoxin system VapB family antitoxin n=1 Tax=Ornithinimicrobium sp. TaxID=1977084 RepID=UPI003D9AF4A2